MASASALLQSRNVPFITTPIADIADKALSANLLQCAWNSLIQYDFLEIGTNTIDEWVSSSKRYKNKYGININITAKQIYTNIRLYVTSFLRCEDFICALKSYPGGFSASIPYINDYILANKLASTGKQYPNYYQGDYYRIAIWLLNKLRIYLIILYNATNQTDYFFSFECKNIPNDVICWLWQVLGKLKYAPYTELFDYIYSFNHKTGSARIDPYSTQNGTILEIQHENFLNMLEHVIEYVKNKFSDIIIDQFGDLNPPAFTDIRTFALAGKTNLSASTNNKTLQVNNNQIIKICQGENVILDLTN